MPLSLKLTHNTQYEKSLEILTTRLLQPIGVKPAISNKTNAEETINVNSISTIQRRFLLKCMAYEHTSRATRKAQTECRLLLKNSNAISYERVHVFVHNIRGKLVTLYSI